MAFFLNTFITLPNRPPIAAKTNIHTFLNIISILASKPILDAVPPTISAANPASATLSPFM